MQNPRILIVFSAADQKDALEIWRALDEAGLCSQLAFANNLTSPLMAGTTSLNDNFSHMLVVSSSAAKEDVFVSSRIHEFLGHSPRTALFLVGARNVDRENTESWVNPTIAFQRSGKAGLLSPADFQSQIVGFVSASDYKNIAREIRHRISGKTQLAANLVVGSLVRHRISPAWTAAAASIALIVSATVVIQSRDMVRKGEIASSLARQQTASALIELEDRLSASARSEVFGVLDEVILDIASDPSSQTDVEHISHSARLLHVLGEARISDGDLDGAMEAYLRAADATAVLFAMAPDEPQRIFDHAQSVFWIGDAALRAGRYELASQQYSEYENLARRLIEIDPNNPVYRGEFAYSQVNSGAIDLEFDRLELALERFDRAIEYFEEGLVEQGIVEADAVANAQGWAAAPLRSLGRLDEAVVRRTEEVAIYEQLVAEHRQSRHYRTRLANAYRALALLQMDLGELASASVAIEQAGEIYAGLVAERPDSREIRRHHLALERSRARLALWAGNTMQAQLINASARRDFSDGEGVEISDNRFVDRGYFDLLAAEIALEFNAYDAALSSSSSALVSFERDVSSSGSRLRHFAAGALLAQGQALFALGRTGEAQNAWRAGLAHINAMPIPRDLRAEDYRSRLLFVLGRGEEAEQAREALIELNYRRPDFLEFWAAPDTMMNVTNQTPNEEVEDG